MKNDDELAQIIWDYHLLNHNLEKADCILALGSYDPNVAKYASQLYLENWAPYLIFSGGVVRPKGMLENDVPKTEAEAFRDIALQMSIPPNAILLENQATNTAENFIYTKILLNGIGLDFKSFIVVQMPYMERRAYATARKLWKHEKLMITSQKISYNEYISSSGISKETTINGLIGDLQRIKIYPEKGFQIFQDIPPNVMDAFNQLVSLGYNKTLIT